MEWKNLGQVFRSFVFYREAITGLRLSKARLWFHGCPATNRADSVVRSVLQ
jgi:hypothetical protein